MAESYMHLYAKQLVAKWLLENLIETNCLNLNPIFTGPQENIFDSIIIEYPILPEILINDSIIHYKNLFFNNKELQQKWIEQNKYRILYKLDIAIADNNFIKYGIEIIHKSTISDKKRNFFNNSNCILYSIEDDWILNQTKTPRALNTHEINLMDLLT